MYMKMLPKMQRLDVKLLPQRNSEKKKKKTDSVR